MSHPTLAAPASLELEKRSMAYRIAKSLVLASLSLIAAHARADDVSYSGFANGAETVTFSVSAPNTALTEYVYAGGFLTSLNGGPSFTTYCIDLYQFIAFGAPAYTDYS